jgi:hypothetical protein
MAQVINLMSRATGVTAAANHNAGTAQPTDGTYPTLQPFCQGITITERSKITVAQLTQLATGDVLVAGAIPAYCELVDAMIITDAIDSGAGLTLTAGVLLQDFTNIVANSNIITTSTVGQAGGIARASVADGLRNTVNNQALTWLGLYVAAGVAGLNATTTNELDFLWSYRAAYNTGDVVSQAE